MQRLILLNIDPPQHTKLRGIVSRGFTPRAIGRLREALTARAERIVQTALAEGTGDFVTDVAAELPLQAIAELLGVPQEDRGKIFDWSNEMIGYDDPEYGGDSQAAAAELVGYAMVMAEDRRACPRDDIVTKLVHAQVDGGQLSADEFGFFVILLSVAGNETTRNAISHGMLAFLDHPDQWELFRAERPATAVDEIVRWATPVTVFQRTALADTTLGGQQIQAGQRVGLFYRSANFDEEVFDSPGAVRHPAQPQPAPGLRRHRDALLPRREPGPAGDRSDLQRDRRRHAGHPPGRRRRTAALRLAQRHQAAAGQLHLTRCARGGLRWRLAAGSRPTRRRGSTKRRAGARQRVPPRAPPRLRTAACGTGVRVGPARRDGTRARARQRGVVGQKCTLGRVKVSNHEHGHPRGRAPRGRDVPRSSAAARPAPGTPGSACSRRPTSAACRPGTHPGDGTRPR